MAKQTGLGDLLVLDGVDLSGDVGAVQKLSQASPALDMTAINATGHQRIHGEIDGEISFDSFFNDATGQQHLTLRTKPATDRIACYLKGSTLGNAAAALVAKQINYDWSRPIDGSLNTTVQCLANKNGLDYCIQLTAGKRTDSSATNGTGVDGGAASALGVAAYLQMIAFTGRSVTVALEESSDDASGDPYAAVTGGAFAAASAVGAERIVTGLTLAVEQWLRVVTTGTFLNAVFSVVATRFPYAA